MTEKNKYENIPVSEKTQAGMTWTIDNRAYLQRMFCMQDSYMEEYISKTYDEHANLIIGVVRDLIAEQNATIFAKIDEQNKVIKEIQDQITVIQGLILDIQEEVHGHEVRIKRLEDKVKKLLAEHQANHK